MDPLCFQCIQALHQKDRGESTTADLVAKVQLGLFFDRLMLA